MNPIEHSKNMLKRRPYHPQAKIEECHRKRQIMAFLLEIKRRENVCAYKVKFSQ